MIEESDFEQEAVGYEFQVHLQYLGSSDPEGLMQWLKSNLEQYFKVLRMEGSYTFDDLPQANPVAQFKPFSGMHDATSGKPVARRRRVYFATESEFRNVIQDARARLKPPPEDPLGGETIMVVASDANKPPVDPVVFYGQENIQWLQSIGYQPQQIQDLANRGTTVNDVYKALNQQQG